MQPVEVAEHGVQLLLARDVDARRGLVQHEQLGVADERTRKQDALLLTLHGSRHRVFPSGYALAVIRFDEQGLPLEPEVILPQASRANAHPYFTVAVMNHRGSGFWPERPLDVASGPEGQVYVSMTGGRILALRPA